jgi:hypothetical protein
MYPEINKKTYDEAGIPEDLPFVSIIIPFQPKMNFKSGFDTIINEAAAKTEKELMKSYPESKAAPVIEKMHHVLHNLDLKKHKRQSIGIFVSPLLEKVFYFNYCPPPENSNYSTAN